jgi:hypothetical protein
MLTGTIADLLAAVAAQEPDALWILADYYEDVDALPLANALRSENAFLTGSHRYGIPHEKSDVDVCCKVSQPELVVLGKLYGSPTWNTENVTCNCRIGNLNLIAAASQPFFDTWEQVTDTLEASKPVTKAQAIQAFNVSMQETYRGPTPENDDLPF